MSTNTDHEMEAFRQYELALHQMILRGLHPDEQPLVEAARQAGQTWAAANLSLAGDLEATYQQAEAARKQPFPSSDGWARQDAIFEAAWIVAALEQGKAAC